MEEYRTPGAPAEERQFIVEQPLPPNERLMLTILKMWPTTAMDESEVNMRASSIRSMLACMSNDGYNFAELWSTVCFSSLHHEVQHTILSTYNPYLSTSRRSARALGPFCPEWITWE